jgi:molybdopterin molybdotransferase
MKTVEEAKKLIQDLRIGRRLETILVTEAHGQVLSADVFSPIDMPPFAQSAMDGYALGDGDRLEGSSFMVMGESAAGCTDRFRLNAGECIRIFTGAPVPENAKAVVQQEWVERSGDHIVLQKVVPSNMHIRHQGEQMKTGEVAMETGTLLNPAAIGFLQMLGISEVEVFAKPKVSVLVTGNELIAPGKSLKYGQIYESNGQMLLAALNKEGVQAGITRVGDELDLTIASIERLLQENDILIISGGISVGDHDHVGTALQHLGVTEVFYEVAQKPGKPIYFGTKEGKAVFGLPGNPAASLSCFYEYVLPALRKYMVRTDLFLPSFKLPLKNGTIKAMPRAQFLKVKVEDGRVHVLEGQSSAMLNTFALANALAYVPAHSAAIVEGDFLEVHLLP